MATTQIKDGFDGGSDNQLKVNADGSINVDVTGGGGGVTNTNLTEIGGSPITLGQTTEANSIPVTIASNQTPIPVTGTFTAAPPSFSTISPGYPAQISVGTTSIQLFAANMNRKYAHIFNNSAEQIFIQYQVSAALNQGVRINPGSFFTLDSDNLWLGIVNAIGLVSSQLIDVLEGE